MKPLLFALIAITLVSCNGGRDFVGDGAHHHPNITAQEFVNALNDVDGSNGNDNYIEKDTHETERVGGWFVYYDARHDRTIAVDLDYIQKITYDDYYKSNYNLAEKYREILKNDTWLDDGWGHDYEVVYYSHYEYGEWFYEGRDSGLIYDDQDEITDVSLLAADAEKVEFYEKASKVSLAYELDIKTSLSLVSLGQKVEKMLHASGNELTLADQAALMNDIQRLTGVNLTEFNEALRDDHKKKELVKKVADHIGTSAENLENRLLPELFSIEL